MNLLIIRHAKAVERRKGLEDASRALTDQGRQRFIASVAGLGRLGVKLDRVYHSPWLRAVQTAELLTPLLKGSTEVTPWLAAPPAPQLLELLEGDSVSVVGHEPWLTALISLLLHGTTQFGDRFELKKGGVACLEGQPRAGSMRLTALYPPRALRAGGDDDADQ